MSGETPKEVSCVPVDASASPAVETPPGQDSGSLKSESFLAEWNNRRLVPAICFFLAALVWVVFGQTLHHGFVNFDDDLYVYENPVVQKGLSWQGFRWALTYGEIGHWHPLTWISHMLDCQLYGLDPGGHHLTNVLLHTASAILLFLVLRRMTGFLWRSAFVAAVFAIHPLRVESVAWIAERKDVLSGLFFMLTLWAYTRYVAGDRAPGPCPDLVVGHDVRSAGPNDLPRRLQMRTPPAPGRSRFTFHVSWNYGLVLLFFALGLLSKNMLVTTPCVLLLLDYWPLGRLSSFTPQLLLRIVAEKIPLFILAVGSCVATALVSEKLAAAVQLPFGRRMENAVVSCITYLWQMIHPIGLACVYPNPTNNLPFWQVAGALGLLLAITGAAWVFRRTRPWLAVGWLWYLGMLVPVIGFVQISYYAHADRYTYLPQIGLVLLLTWAVADLCAGWRHRRLVLGGLAAIILVALIFPARTQTTYWRNSELLWSHALACTADNYIAHNNYGNVLPQPEKVDEAIVQYQTALHIKPDYAEAWYNLGNALFQKGGTDEAIAHYQTALQFNPGYAEAFNNLGYALFKKGRVDEAIVQYQKALEIKPDFAFACYNLGDALLQKGAVDEAITQYQRALRINPDLAKARNNLGNAFLQQNRLDAAIAQYQQALQINPRYAGAHYNLGYALLQKGGVSEAVNQFQTALQLDPGFAAARDNLDLALRQKSAVDETLAQYQQALQHNPDSVEVLNNLAWLLATCPDAEVRDGAQAVQYARHACELTHYGVTVLVGTLAAAYAEAGRYDDAVATAEKACALAQASGDRDLLERNQKLLAMYRARQPYHEPVAH